MLEQRAVILLRLDPALRDRLVAQAKRNDRSVSSEGARILRDVLAPAPAVSQGAERAFDAHNDPLART